MDCCQTTFDVNSDIRETYSFVEFDETCSVRLALSGTEEAVIALNDEFALVFNLRRRFLFAYCRR